MRQCESGPLIALFLLKHALVITSRERTSASWRCVMVAIRGAFYEFHTERVISRSSQPLDTRAGLEIGPLISRETALQRARTEKEVYTFAREDAFRLAVQLSARRPV